VSRRAPRGPSVAQARSSVCGGYLSHLPGIG